jgi:hypothetical protein
MALVDIIRNAVHTADLVTKSVQEPVSFEAWTGQTPLGAATYAPVLLPKPKALVEHKAHLRKLSDGRFVEVKTKLTFLEVIANTTPLSPLSPRDNPVDPRDKFTTANGVTGPIVDVTGMQDAGKGRPFLLEVFLGGTSGTR